MLQELGPGLGSSVAPGRSGAQRPHRTGSSWQQVERADRVAGQPQAGPGASGGAGGPNKGAPTVLAPASGLQGAGPQDQQEVAPGQRLHVASMPGVGRPPARGPLPPPTPGEAWGLEAVLTRPLVCHASSSGTRQSSFAIATLFYHFIVFFSFIFSKVILFKNLDIFLF